MTEALALPRVRRRLGGSPPTRRARLALGLIGTVAVLAIAESAVRSGLIDGRYVPSPSTLASELAVLVQEPSYWSAIGQTLLGWALGLGIASAIAIPGAILIATLEVVRRATRPIIEFLRPVPSVGLIPVAILIFGIGLEPKVFIVAFASLWPLLVQTISGLRDVDPTLLTTAASYRIRPIDRTLHVVIPSALPYVATGFRIAATTAIIVALTAELIIGSPGLGKEVSLAQAGNATVTMYALIATAGLLGVAINVVVRVVEARLLRWHPTYREIAR